MFVDRHDFQGKRRENVLSTIVADFELILQQPTQDRLVSISLVSILSDIYPLKFLNQSADRTNDEKRVRSREIFDNQSTIEISLIEINDVSITDDSSISLLKANEPVAEWRKEKQKNRTDTENQFFFFLLKLKSHLLVSVSMVTERHLKYEFGIENDSLVFFLVDQYFNVTVYSIFFGRFRYTKKKIKEERHVWTKWKWRRSRTTAESKTSRLSLVDEVESFRLISELIDCSDTAFKQQRLPAWQPIITAQTALPVFLVIGIVFIPIGIGLVVTSNGVRWFIELSSISTSNRSFSGSRVRSRLYRYELCEFKLTWLDMCTGLTEY